MMYKATVAALLLLLASGSMFAEGLFPQVAPESQRASSLAKVGAGCLGELVATIGVTVVVLGTAVVIPTHGSQEESIFGWAAVEALSLCVVVPAAAAFGVKQVGDRYDESGSFWASYAGGLVGVAGACGVTFLTASVAGPMAMLVLGPTLPPLGAMVGYNMSRPEQNRSDLQGRRFLPPSMSLTLTSRSDGARVAGISVRLLTVRL